MGTATRPDHQLSPQERDALNAARGRLHDVVTAYAQLDGAESHEGESVLDSAQFARVQADVEEAESELWRLREMLLGWSRPMWTPRAALVADWFSVDEAVYDDTSPASSR